MKKFLQLVEIRTKVASVLPFIIGNLFVYYRYETWSIPHAFILLVSLLSIDMATTAINNYMDYKKAIKKEGYNFEEHNAIVKHKMSQKNVRRVIVLLLLIGIIFGCYLVYLTDWVVFFIGLISFTVGILYSFGPLPISRTPFGEMFSGLFMGFGIVFISAYIQIYQLELIKINIDARAINLGIQYVDVLIIFILALPLTLSISNIMLANNLCDMADDFENKRYTLPIVIGKDKAFKIYFLSIVLSLSIVPVLVIFKILPWHHLLVALVYVPIFKMYAAFKNSPSKKDTFVTAVKSLVLSSLAIIISLMVGILIM